jgi:hypothetical protein
MHAAPCCCCCCCCWSHCHPLRLCFLDQLPARWLCLLLLQHLSSPAQ